MGRKLLTEAEINTIRQLRREGFSYSMLSKELGISRTTACKYSQDIMIPGQPKRFKSDSINIILSKLTNILKQLLDCGVSCGEVDSMLKRCRQILDGYDTDILFILQNSKKGYINFIRAVLNELGLIEKYGLTIQDPTDSHQTNTGKAPSPSDDQQKQGVADSTK